MTILQYLNFHYKQTRESDTKFNSIEELRDEIGDQEVNDVIDDYSKQDFETRVYVIDVDDDRVEDVDVPTLTDEEFIFEAEEQGKVYTLTGFAEAFNNEEINSHTDFIRFIEVAVSH
jgi:hypothetical protein